LPLALSLLAQTAPAIHDPLRLLAQTPPAIHDPLRLLAQTAPAIHDRHHARCATCDLHRPRVDDRRACSTSQR
jgi:hypothetical protein